MLGLFSGELIFGGAYYWREFCVSKWVGLDNKNSLKHYENSLKQLALTVHGVYSGGLIIGRIFASEICFGGGLIFREGLFLIFCGGVGGWEKGAYYQEFYGMPSIFSNILNLAEPK